MPNFARGVSAGVDEKLLSAGRSRVDPSSDVGGERATCHQLIVPLK